MTHSTFLTLRAERGEIRWLKTCTGYRRIIRLHDAEVYGRPIEKIFARMREEGFIDFDYKKHMP